VNEARTLARQLLTSLAETVDRLQALSDADLDAAVSHGCAMDGGLRRLLVHNAEHDRIHAGAISNARYEQRTMQESELARLLRDWLRERVELAGQLLASSDSALDAKAAGDDWTVREHVEHVLYWEHDSIDSALAELATPDASAKATESR
jgi:predicted membrane chloride channel (bestrophin family)